MNLRFQRLALLVQAVLLAKMKDIVHFKHFKIAYSPKKLFNNLLHCTKNSST